MAPSVLDIQIKSEEGIKEKVQVAAKTEVKAEKKSEQKGKVE